MQEKCDWDTCWTFVEMSPARIMSETFLFKKSFKSPHSGNTKGVSLLSEPLNLIHVEFNKDNPYIVLKFLHSTQPMEIVR